LIRDSIVAGPALAAFVGTSAWLVARCFSSAILAANDNAPRVAPALTGR
jgi:hypothetical protein